MADRALRLARDILDLDEFRDLALPGGLAKRGRPEPEPEPPPDSSRRRPKRARTDNTPTGPGDAASPRGRRIRYEEVAFEQGSRAHSRFAAGVVQGNILHPDYQHAARSIDARLAYAALMIGKESIAWNDRSGGAGDFLETLLAFHFKLQGRRARRGRRSAAPEAEQAPLDLSSG